MIYTTITARELLRNQRDIVERIKRTKQPTLLIKEKEPQVVLMPIEDAEELDRLRRKEAFEQIALLARDIEEEHYGNSLPRDVSRNHDAYFSKAWKEQERLKQQP